MTKGQQTAYTEAMKHARHLATLKRRSAMAPVVHKWAEQMKIMLAGGNNGR